MRVSGEMVMYIIRQGSDIRADELKSFLESKMGTNQGGQVMSEFDRVIGLAREEGGVMEARRILLDLIEARFGFEAPPEEVEKRVEGLAEDALRRCLRRFVTAERLEDLFE
jgi:hypothetical protein